MHPMIAALVISFCIAAGSHAAAQDSSLTIEQVPEEKRLQEDARDEGLLPEGVPERCADPDVAASDPACAPGEEDLTESFGLPLIEDTAENQKDKLVPGVTINRSPRSR